MTEGMRGAGPQGEEAWAEAPEVFEKQLDSLGHQRDKLRYERCSDKRRVQQLSDAMATVQRLNAQNTKIQKGFGEVIAGIKVNTGKLTAKHGAAVERGIKYRTNAAVGASAGQTTELLTSIFIVIKNANMLLLTFAIA